MHKRITLIYAESLHVNSTWIPGKNDVCNGMGRVINFGLSIIKGNFFLG